MSDIFESDLPQNYENELSEHLTGPCIPEDDGEVPLVRTDIPETALDMTSEEFDTQQLEVEYEKEFEDESEEDFEDESEEECEDDLKMSMKMILKMSLSNLKTSLKMIVHNEYSYFYD